MLQLCHPVVDIAIVCSDFEHRDRNKMLKMVCGLLVVFSVLTPVHAQAERGLVVRWDFSEGKGDVLRDRSGNGNHAEIAGATWVQQPKGHALQFDGVDDCAIAGRDKSLIFGKGDFTVQIRIKPMDINKTAHLISKWGVHEFAIQVGGYGDKAIMFLTNFKQFGYSGKGAIAKETWTHLTYVKAGTNLTCYVNGELSIGFQTTIPESIADTKADLRLGGCKGYGFFKGLVREVRIYRRALNAEEVYANYERIPDADLESKPRVLAAPPVMAGQLPLVVAGEPAATIVIPARSDNSTLTPREEEIDKWTNRAAQWVQDYVKRSSGAMLQIVTEDQAPKGNIISVGHTRLAAKAKINTADLKWDGCKMIVKGNVLYLIGNDDPMGKNDWGGSSVGPKGTCRSATLFLENVLGVRWFLPTEDGVLVPKHRTIAVPQNLDKTFVPAFGFCHGRYPYGHGTPASIANNYRTAVKLMTMGGHTYYVWLKADKYFDEHPEYFALINGTRVKQGNHLCSSNLQVRNIIVTEMRKAFDQGWDWVALGQEDGYLRCQCQECEKQDNFRDFAPHGWGPREGETWDEFIEIHSRTPDERLLLMHRWIIDQCRESHPDKKVHMLLYVPTLFPSNKFDKLGDNVVGEMAFYHNRLDYKILDMWKDKVHALTVMCTWFDMTSGAGMGMGVMMTPREVARKLRVYREKNVVGIYGIHEANWGLQGPSFYVQGKLLGDPSLDHDELVAEYCRGLYGKAANAMKDFFDILYSRSTRRLGLQEASGRVYTPGERHLIVYTPRFMRRLEPMLERAEIVARRDSQNVQRLVSLTRMHFDYLKLMTLMQASYQAWQANETTANFEELKQRVDAFEDFRMKIITETDPAVTSLAGYDWFCKFLVGGGLDVNYYTAWHRYRKKLDLNNVRGMVCGFSGSAIRKPITMDFTKPPQKRMAAQLKVERVPSGPKLDGLLQKDEWANAQTAVTKSLKEGTVPITTTVRAVYDHDSLYLAFECEEPLIDKMKLQSVGRDGNVWKLDHVEFFFDPEGSRRRRYQLMAAPCRDATYDARIGFNTLNDEDIPWNGDWTYGFRVDTQQNKWTMEVRITFKSLGMETPADGGTLRANFARARYASGGHDPESYLWSHGETLGFSDPAAFGTLVFEHILY